MYQNRGEMEEKIVCFFEYFFLKMEKRILYNKNTDNGACQVPLSPFFLKGDAAIWNQRH